jgi:hypothetical protein
MFIFGRDSFIVARGVASRLGIRFAVLTAVAPPELRTVSDAMAELSGFPWKTTRAYSAPDAPPDRQTPVPLDNASTPPAATDCGPPLEQAVVTVVVPAVNVNVDVRLVPAMVAVTTTLPTDEPSVTFDRAMPAVSVVAVAGDTEAAPLVTTNATLAPWMGSPVLVATLTASGDCSAEPTIPVCPLPDTMTTLDGAPLPPAPVTSDPPHAAAHNTANTETTDHAARLRGACMQPP